MPAEEEEGLRLCAVCGRPEDDETREFVDDKSRGLVCQRHRKLWPVTLDCETVLIGPDEMPPDLVCWQIYDAFEEEENQFLLRCVADDDCEALLTEALSMPDALWVGHNVAFDFAVIVNRYPDLLPLVFHIYEEDRVLDTMIREKLYNLRTSGTIAEMVINGKKTGRRLSYSIARLVKDRIGKDIDADKNDPTSWRLRYCELQDTPSEDWPEDAVAYCRQDVELTWQVFNLQEGSPTDDFQAKAAFAMFLIGAIGMQVDEVEVRKIQEQLEEDLAPEKMQILLEEGVLRAAEAPRPHKNNPGKMTKGKPESVDKASLQSIIKGLCKMEGKRYKLTPSGVISTSDSYITEVIEQNDAKRGTSKTRDLWLRTLETFQTRQRLQKLVTTELPRLQRAIDESDGLIRTDYDILKETGRTSAYASKLYPGWNVQQIDPRVRGCIAPRDDYLLCSCDYGALELCTLAQTTYDLFGQSKLRELIIRGEDPHAYLGAQIAYELDAEFRAWVDGEEVKPEVCFYKLKGSDSEDKAFFKHFRTFAKPTGLGFPGGLGIETFCAFAKAVYKLDILPEIAIKLKEIWLKSFPENRKYLKMAGAECPEHEGPETLVQHYVSPMGMLRVGVNYTQWSNGRALQTPAAEGAKRAAWELVRACWEPGHNLILEGAIPVAFIHDEFLVEVEEEKAHEQANEIARIMVEAMEITCPDVPIKAEPCLMVWWNKSAEPVFDTDNRLIHWTPHNK